MFPAAWDAVCQKDGSFSGAIIWCSSGGGGEGFSIKFGSRVHSSEDDGKNITICDVFMVVITKFFVVVVAIWCDKLNCRVNDCQQSFRFFSLFVCAATPH